MRKYVSVIGIINQLIPRGCLRDRMHQRGQVLAVQYPTVVRLLQSASRGSCTTRHRISLAGHDLAFIEVSHHESTEMATLLKDEAFAGREARVASRRAGQNRGMQKDA